MPTKTKAKKKKTPAKPSAAKRAPACRNEASLRSDGRKVKSGTGKVSDAVDFVKRHKKEIVTGIAVGALGVLGGKSMLNRREQHKFKILKLMMGG